MKNVTMMLAFLLINGVIIAQQASNAMMTDSSKMTYNDDLNYNAPNGISFKRTFLDYKSVKAGNATSLSNFKSYNSGFEVGYVRDFTNNVRLYVPIRVGVFNVGDNLPNVTFGEIDAQVQYRIVPKKSSFRPYILAGAGVNTENLDSFHVQVPVGVGLDIKIAKKTFINLQGEYRLSLNQNNRNNIQLSLGFIHYFGKGGTKPKPIEEPTMKEEDKKMAKDSDGDGITDDLDLCPDKKGLKQFNGCPDSDGDGVADPNDLCPEVAGLKALNGCPDTDGDGVADKDDDCPNLAGTRANRGCPSTDTDNDGIIDDQDECPTIAGTSAAHGCPDRDGDGVADKKDKCPNVAGSSKNGCPDTDRDGVDDSEDRCPNTYGPASNKGCPEIKKEDKETLNIAMRDVQFEHNSAKLLAASYKILDQISGILSSYPEYKIEINGHTDNTGTAERNKKLSEERARACRDYLISKGLAWSRVASRGYGSAKPIASNDTFAGRQTNRRVEFKLYLE